MKKNMLTIVVIALCFINVVLSAVMVFTVIPTANRTNELVSQVMGIIDLELESPEAKEEVSMTDLEGIAFTKILTINLKSVEGQKKDPFAVIDGATVYLNKKGEGYSSLKESLANYEATISEIITNTFSKYTKDEVQNNRDSIKDEVLKALQDRFATTTIADVSFENLRVQ